MNEDDKVELDKDGISIRLVKPFDAGLPGRYYEHNGEMINGNELDKLPEEDQIVAKLKGATEIFNRRMDILKGYASLYKQISVKIAK